MIATPYMFEARLSAEEFQRIGQFACRWALIEHTIGNCLRRLLDLEPKPARVMIFPLSLDLRMTRIGELIKDNPLNDFQMMLFQELKPLIRAMQYLRTSTLHGIVVDLGGDAEPYFHLRSKNRDVTKQQLFGCEDLINYTAHVTLAFRLTLGEKHDPWARTYALPDRPPIPEFLPDDCRAFPKGSRAAPESPPESSPG
jgi:hypothetical protein